MWRFITIMLVALSLGGAFCHVLELPAKMRLDPALYAAVQSTLYQAFGPVGAVLEPGSILAAGVLAFLVRKRRPAFPLTLAGAGFLSAALAVWFAVVAPVNAEALQTSQTAPEALPQMWARLRGQWEFGHAARFVLQFAGLSALVWSVLGETPGDRDHLGQHPTRASVGIPGG